MKPFDYFKNVYQNNYANFDGRARRSEYWYFQLFYLLIYSALLFVPVALSTVVGDAASMGTILAGIFAFGSIVPSIALSIRRMHDVGKSGWYLLLGIIPIIGALYLFYLAVQDSQVGTNQYGPNPKNEAELELEDHLISDK